MARIWGRRCKLPSFFFGVLFFKWKNGRVKQYVAAAELRNALMFAFTAFILADPAKARLSEYCTWYEVVTFIKSS